MITLIEEMMANYKKMILTTILWTLTALVGITAIFVCVMFFAFPKNVGDFFYSLGNNGIASSMYMRVYEKDNDISYCYKALNIEIGRKNNSRIVDIYETFEKDKNASDFMSQLKNRNENLNIGLLEKSSLLNEEDYLKNRYVKALISSSDSRKAYNLAVNYFSDYRNFTFKNQGVYALHHFINLEGYNDFDVAPSGFEGKLIDAIKEYFDSCINIFENNKSVDTNLDRAYLISLGNRILQVGQNINSICSDNKTLIDENNVKMENINNYIKDIL